MVEKQEGEDHPSRNEGRRLRHGRNYLIISSAKIDLHGSRSIAGKEKTAQIRALIGCKDKPIGGCTTLARASARPIIDCQGESGGIETGKGQRADGAGSKIQMRTSSGKNQRSH